MHAGAESAAVAAEPGQVVVQHGVEQHGVDTIPEAERASRPRDVPTHPCRARA